MYSRAAVARSPLPLDRAKKGNLRASASVYKSMSKNPFVNALAASGYISLIATAIFNSPTYITDNELGMMAPILFLSLFVFSAAMMGYFFVYQPFLLLIEGDKKGATKLFLTTVFAFAGITGTMLLAWLLLSGVLA
ncbi:MAG: hypothetical protein WCS97_03140 [Candidatus Paceibacterota bacterium]